MSKLIILTQGGIKISEHLIQSEVVHIGRLPTNDIQINNPGVSAQHARILISGNTYLLEDLNSRNGTFVNRNRIQQPHALSNGDQINFPNCKLQFFTADEDDEQTYNEFSAWWLERKHPSEQT